MKKLSIDPLTGDIKFLQKEEELTEHKLNPLYRPVPSKLSEEQRIKYIEAVGEEIVKVEEIPGLLKQNRFIHCYDGFEPSGRMHIAQGILKMVNVNRLVDAGCIFTFWVADWFAMLNDKFNGDLDKIRTVGKYFIEIWKAVGMKMSNVRFLWASEHINDNAEEYWMQVMDIARKNSVSRVMRCSQIMGREESNDMYVSQLFYPCMQATDVFYLKTDICQLGMDQRKVNMLAREYAKKKKLDSKPIILSSHMIPGLKEGQFKMSKSDPDSAIFMEDSSKDVEKKIKKAFAKAGVVEENPILDYTKYLVFGVSSSFKINRTEENGGDITYNSYEDLEKDYISEKLNVLDLKISLAKEINRLIQPVRDHFENNAFAKDLLKQVRKIQEDEIKRKKNLK